MAWDPYTGLITILTDAAAAWATNGADISGEHLLIKYDAARKKTLWTLNITDLTHERYGGFQDVETDRCGNTYVVGSWPGTILRADKHGKAIKNWYVPEPLPPSTNKGFGGLAVVPGTDILLSNGADGKIYRFDMQQEVGAPVEVPMRPEVLCGFTDAAYLPPRYRGRVLLVACGTEGIQVLRSADGKWKSVEHLGMIPGRGVGPYEGGFVTAAVQVGDGIYMVHGFGDTPWVEGTVAGNRTSFPWPDITKDVDDLLEG